MNPKQAQEGKGQRTALHDQEGKEQRTALHDQNLTSDSGLGNPVLDIKLYPEFDSFLCSFINFSETFGCLLFYHCIRAFRRAEVTFLIDLYGQLIASLTLLNQFCA
jgi:hypothetical protein